MIAIIDYGLGNPGSIYNMLNKMGFKAIITSRTNEISSSSHIIIPGVGSFDRGIENLSNLGLTPVLSEEVLIKKKPILGICLGMQMMCKGSEEGNAAGLNWVDARTVKFNFEGSDPDLKIPHIGWADTFTVAGSPLFATLNDEARFYYVHSYHCVLNNSDFETASCVYGSPFTAAFSYGNIHGVQFHPEKSHKFGMRLLTNFANITV
jgi:imidazole glycerol-phosphate synthase subunit HisH